MEAIIRAPAISGERRQLTRLRKPDRVPPGAGFDVTPLLGVADPADAAEKSLSDLEAQAVERDLEEKLQFERECAAIRSQAERRGFAEGKERGDELARMAVSEQLERFASIVASLYQARKNVLDEAEDVAVEIVYTTVCRIIGDLAITRDAVAGMVNQTLLSFQQNDGFVVCLNPQDLALLRATPDASFSAAIDPRWQMRGDSSIRVGGCIVEGASGTLDARLDIQLMHLRETLLAVRKNRESVEETS